MDGTCIPLDCNGDAGQYAGAGGAIGHSGAGGEPVLERTDDDQVIMAFNCLPLLKLTYILWPGCVRYGRRSSRRLTTE